jgi:hypothetical protein
VPSQRTRLDAWRESYPETQVLLPPPASETVTGDYARYGQRGYQGYDQSDRIGIGENDFDDNRLHPKTQVIGVAIGGEAVAYPLPRVDAAGVVNDTVGGEAIVVAAIPGGFMFAYHRTVDGSVLEFAREDGDHLTAGGSTWAIQTGRAIDGPHAGTVLEPANDRSQLFWFAWADFNPDTAIYEAEG